MVGRKLGLPIAALLALTPGSASGAPSVEVAAATPFAEVAARFPLSEDATVGARLQLVDGRALRLGPTLGLAWGALGPARLRAELLVARAFGITTASTFDAELVQEVLLPLDEVSWVTLRLGLIGYLGPSRSQTGLVGYGALRVSRDLGSGLTLGFELGWLANPHAHRPLLAIILGQAF